MGPADPVPAGRFFSRIVVPGAVISLASQQYGGVQDVLVGEIQAPYDFDLVGEALLHAADDRRGVGQLEALRTFDGDYRSRDPVGRDVRIMEPSVLSVASMCRAVIFGFFPMRRVRFFPGHVPAVLTSVDAGRACGLIGTSANQDGGRHGRRGSAMSPKNVTDPRRNPDTRFAAEDDGGRGIGAVLAGHDGRRGLCESAMPWLASYV